MTARHDLVALKLERALLQQQVELMGTQQSRLAAILEKKRMRRQRQAVNGGGGHNRGGRSSLQKLPALSPPPPLPVAPVHKKNIVTQKPQALLTNATIQRFRQAHVLRTRGKEALERQVVTPGNARKSRNRNRSARQQKSLPPSKAPPSHFPDRYARNELPCSIEHGTSGKF